MPNRAEQTARKYERKQIAAQTNLERRVAALYEAAIQEVTAMAQLQTLPAGKFSLSKLPALSAKVEEAINSLSSGLEATIRNGIADAWELSNEKNNNLFDHRIDRALIPEGVTATFYDPNKDALAKFADRKVSGMNLSDRVWQASQGFRGELERSLGEGIATGKSAQRMSRDIRQSLRNPDALFRRVRNAEGTLQLSRAAEAVNPGQGVYRSSYKNAMRLTRTETNMAYRSADLARYEKTPFVIGFEVKLSNNHPKYDICDGLAGKYPVDFKYVGWHPHCRCFIVPILASDEDFEKYEAAIMNGTDKDFKFQGRIEEPHAGFSKWIQSNQDRLSGLKSPPYFLRDNPGYVNALQTVPAPKTPRAPAAKVKAEKTAKVPKAAKDAPYTLGTAERGYLKSRGWEFYNEAGGEEFFNKHLRGLDLKQINQFLDATEKKYPGLAWTNRAVNWDGKERMRLQFKGNYNGRDVHLVRRFMADGTNNSKVYHELFSLPKDLQGNGLSKEVLSSFYDQYKKAGISEITVTANLNVGGYAWARYGFAAKSKSQLMTMIEYEAPFEYAHIFRKKVEDWYAKNPNGNFPMRIIADFGRGYEGHAGKKFLLGTEWSGVLNLKDKKAKAMFEKYLKGEK